MAKIKIEIDDKASKPLSKIDKEANNTDDSLLKLEKQAKATSISFKKLAVIHTTVAAAMTAAVVRTANLEKAMFGLTDQTKDWITQATIQYGTSKEIIAGFVQTAKVAGLASNEMQDMIDMSIALGRAMPHESIETVVDDLTEFYDTGVEAGLVTRILEGAMGEAELKAASFGDKMKVLEDRARGVNAEFDKTLGAKIDQGMAKITKETDILADAFTDLAKQAGLFTAIDWAGNLAAKAIRVIAREVKGLQLAFAEIGYWYQNFMHGADLQQWLALAKTRQEYRRLSRDPDPVGINEGGGDGGLPTGVVDTSAADAAYKKLLEMQASFYDDYNRATMTNTEYELTVLAEQYTEYAKYVDDKLALEEWFNAEVKRIKEEEVTDYKDFTEGAIQELEAGIGGMFRQWQDGALEFKDTMKNVLNEIIAQMFEILVVKQLISGVGGAYGFAKGGAFVNGVQKFASGGVVTQPTLFPMANGAGLMGEAGAEAIMPLTRMSNGNLGVEAEAVATVVNVNNYGNDNVSVSQDGNNIDIVISKISNDIQRGIGSIGTAIEGRYGLRKA